MQEVHSCLFVFRPGQGSIIWGEGGGRGLDILTVEHGEVGKLENSRHTSGGLRSQVLRFELQDLGVRKLCNYIKVPQL